MGWAVGPDGADAGGPVALPERPPGKGPPWSSAGAVPLPHPSAFSAKSRYRAMRLQRSAFVPYSAWGSTKSPGFCRRAAEKFRTADPQKIHAPRETGFFPPRCAGPWASIDKRTDPVLPSMDPAPLASASLLLSQPTGSTVPPCAEKPDSPPPIPTSPPLFPRPFAAASLVGPHAPAAQIESPPKEIRGVLAGRFHGPPPPLL